MMMKTKKEVLYNEMFKADKYENKRDLAFVLWYGRVVKDGGSSSVVVGSWKSVRSREGVAPSIGFFSRVWVRSSANLFSKS
jgi:hypothetical protein